MIVVLHFSAEAGPSAADFKHYGQLGSFIAVPTSWSPPAGGRVEAFRRWVGGNGAFEASFTNTAATTAEHASTAHASAKIRDEMIDKRVLDGDVQNKDSNDSGKLAAWLSVSHAEKAPKNKTPTS